MDSPFFSTYLRIYSSQHDPPTRSSSISETVTSLPDAVPFEDLAVVGVHCPRAVAGDHAVLEAEHNAEVAARAGGLVDRHAEAAVGADPGGVAAVPVRLRRVERHPVRPGHAHDPRAPGAVVDA